MGRAYAPGVLKAVGVINDKIATTFEASTTGEPAAIRLSVDRNAITTSRRDVAHVRVDVLDGNGLLVPTAEDEIAFDLRGKGKIIGVDNGRPDSHESYQANRRKAFNGLALVLVQSTGEPGSMILSASAPSLKGADIEIVAA